MNTIDGRQEMRPGLGCKLAGWLAGAPGGTRTPGRLLIRKSVSYQARGSARRSFGGAGFGRVVVQAAGWKVTV